MLLKTLKVFILFTGCTILFYYAIMWLNEEYGIIIDMMNQRELR